MHVDTFTAIVNTPLDSKGMLVHEIYDTVGGAIQAYENAQRPAKVREPNRSSVPSIAISLFDLYGDDLLTMIHEFKNRYKDSGFLDNPQTHDVGLSCDLYTAISRHIIERPRDASTIECYDDASDFIERDHVAELSYT